MFAENADRGHKFMCRLLRLTGAVLTVWSRSARPPSSVCSACGGPISRRAIRDKRADGPQWLSGSASAQSSSRRPWPARWPR